VRVAGRGSDVVTLIGVGLAAVAVVVGLSSTSGADMDHDGVAETSTDWSPPAIAHAGPLSSTFPPPEMARTEGRVSERLSELDRLRSTGAISDSEYDAARARILADL